MYDSFQSADFDYNADFDLEEINDQDSGNDFEKILINFFSPMKI